MTAPPPIPTQCPRVHDPYAITLGDAVEAWNKKNHVDPRFAKRMKLHPTVSIMSFVAVTSPPSQQPKALSEEAKKRREEYVADDQLCEDCNCNRVMDARQAIATCPRCSGSITSQSSDTSYREGTQIHTPYLYNKSNHFKDHLKRFTARESTIIDESVLQIVREQLSRRFSDGNFQTVTLDNVHAILKRQHLSKEYMHEMRIWSLVTSNQPPALSVQQERELLHMFQLIEEPWRKHKPAERKNMLSYAYLIHKLSQMLGYDDIALHFKLLKSREKIILQDDLWKKICLDLEWPYCRTI